MGLVAVWRPRPDAPGQSCVSDAEIASIAGCRQATVRSLAARALSALRIHLAASAAMSPGSTHAEGPS